MLGEPLDETALALGTSSRSTVWLAFERAHGQHLDAVTDEQIRATGELLSLDEELRRSDPAESLDSDDVIAMEQPHILTFVHEHIDATLDAHAEQIDVDDVHSVYRVLVEVWRSRMRARTMLHGRPRRVWPDRFAFLLASSVRRRQSSAMMSERWRCNGRAIVPRPSCHVGYDLIDDLNASRRDLQLLRGLQRALFGFRTSPSIRAIHAATPYMTAVFLRQVLTER